MYLLIERKNRWKFELTTSKLQPTPTKNDLVIVPCGKIDKKEISSQQQLFLQDAEVCNTCDVVGPLLASSHCRLCQNDFNGRYQHGNLRRHFRQKHSLLQNLTDPIKQCGICNFDFQGPDARRKHEWKNHRFDEEDLYKRSKPGQNKDTDMDRVAITTPEPRPDLRWQMMRMFSLLPSIDDAKHAELFELEDSSCSGYFVDSSMNDPPEQTTVSTVEHMSSSGALGYNVSSFDPSGTLSATPVHCVSSHPTGPVSMYDTRPQSRNCIRETRLEAIKEEQEEIILQQEQRQCVSGKSATAIIPRSLPPTPSITLDQSVITIQSNAKDAELISGGSYEPVDSASSAWEPFSPYDINPFSRLVLSTKFLLPQDMAANTTGSMEKSVVNRSASLPCSQPDINVLFKLEQIANTLPQRSSSTPSTAAFSEGTYASEENKYMALNRVSLFYSAITEPITLNRGGRGTSQTTNGLDFRRQSTQRKRQALSRMASTRSLKRTRSCDMVSGRNLYSDVPFAHLIRSLSTGNSTLYQSVRKFHSILRVLHSSDKKRHRFRAGKMSISSRKVLMERAYPPVKCEQCARIFTGQQRKRKLARHRKRVHTPLSRNSSLSENPLGCLEYICSHQDATEDKANIKQQFGLVSAQSQRTQDQAIFRPVYLQGRVRRPYHPGLEDMATE
jgi:hypothetical protein